MFRKLKRRFVLTNMAMLSLVLFVSFTATYLIAAYYIQNQNYLKLENIHSNTLRYQESYEKSMLFHMVVTEEYINAFGVIINEQDEVVFDSSFGALPKEWLALAIEQTKGREEGQIALDGRQFLFSKTPAYAKVDSSDELACVEQFNQIAFLDITSSNQDLLQLLLAFVGVGIVTFMAMFGISVMFAKRAVAPIEQSYQKQKRFVQDASHELKTPLASIRANIEVLQANKHETIQNQERWLDHISHEANRMGKLVAELLELARADQTEQIPDQKPICLSNLLEYTILSVEAVIYEKELSLHQQIKPNLFVNGNADKAEQVIRILLDNACKYTDIGGRMEVGLHRQKKYVVLTVSNSGEGIAPEDIDKIFDRFYRVDNSRKNVGSYGLGLSIAKSLVEQMGAKISVTSVPYDKTTFTVQWKMV